ncbi:MAG: hypothetical protein JXK05_02355 [Campylobacterales bacterium]|nr:hypothetical protein [Campylobacterales bacterium]
MSGREYGYSSREETLRHVHRQSERSVAPAKTLRSSKRKADEKFGSQQIDIRQYILVPEGWEGVIFPLYFLLLPYFVGILFIFLFVAGSDIDNFLVLDFTAFFVLWAIGYEIIATLILLTLIVSYFKWTWRHKRQKKGTR